MFEKHPQKYANIGIPEDEDSDWYDRSEFWRAYEPKKKGPPRKFSYREPLFICGHGAHIRVEHNSLFIRNGFTHYPQEQEKIRLFPGDGNLPDRIVLLDTSGGITFDALTWIFEQGISLVQIDWRGRVNCVGNSSGSPYRRELVERQLKLKGSRHAVEFSRELIGNKFDNSISTIKALFPASEKSNYVVGEIQKYRSRLDHLPKSGQQSKILGLEGAVAVVYFRSWHGVPLNWSGLKKKPIPPNWLQIGPRTMSWRKGGDNARHPINAMLNYGYAMLISQLRGQVIATGLDPSIGIAHGNSQNRIPLVYDLIEPLRPIVDCVILRFALSHLFAPDDFTINRFGACRINPQLATVVAKQTSEFEVESVVRDFIKILR